MEESQEQTARIMVVLPLCLKIEFQRQCDEYERSMNKQLIWMIKEWVREVHEENVSAPA